jgi:hypothetical protein
MRGTTINAQVTFVTEECCECGVAFAITKEMQDRLKENHKWFYCPNGHSQHYTGKSDAEKLREQLERAERETARVRAERDQSAAEAAHERNRANGYKGAAAKAKQRSAKGVCPVPGCRRHFADVERHMATKHPEFVGQKDEVTA